MMKNVYSVGQVNTYIKNMFAQDFMMQRISVKGEVSNCKYHSSGHIYFTLKDTAGTINAIITNELVSKLGMKNLSKGVRVEVLSGIVNVDVALNIAYGYSIPEVSAKVQERVKSAIENMTGLEVSIVNVRIATVDMGNNK